jgi:PST family polysaccharide transporter
VTRHPATRWISRSSDLREALRDPLAKNTLAITAVQVANIGLPLLVIPYLARVLSPSSWGLFVFAQSLGFWLGTLIEYGFNLSATREVARLRDQPGSVGRVVAGVAGAKVGLTLVVIVVAGSMSGLVALFRSNPSYLLAALLFAVGYGFSSFWYFQGIERVKLAAGLEVGGKAVGVLLIFVLIEGPADGSTALLILALGAVLGSLLTTALMYRTVPFVRPTFSSAIEALRMGWSMFLFRASVSLYTAANAFLLGLFVGPRIIGYYGGAEKAIKGALFLLTPLTLALYPRLSYLASRDRERSRRIALRALLFFGTLGAAMGLGIALLAPTLTRVFLGPDMAPSAPLLRIMAILPPLIGASGVLGLLWMLPQGWDGTFNRIILSGGVTNLALAFLLAPRFGAAGMSWAVVGAEAVVTLSMFAVAWKRGLLRPSRTPSREAAEGGK